MSIARRYEDLEVWQIARTLAAAAYQSTRRPQFNDLSLAGQMRRSVVSVLSNIAEGLGRKTEKEFVQFLYIARGSTLEYQSQCYVALDQHFITDQEFASLYEQADHICRMLANLIKYLRTKTAT